VPAVRADGARPLSEPESRRGSWRAGPGRWQSGNGALANVTLDQALADDPHYPMACMLRLVIGSGAPPSMAWLPMTPEEVAESYAALEDDGACEDQETCRDSTGSVRGQDACAACGESTSSGTGESGEQRTASAPVV
jgi:hypothetical protein